MRAHSLLLLFVCSLVTTVARASNFDAANQLYEQGKFTEAKAAYEKLIQSGETRANVFYNLGNVDQRLNRTGEAIVNYERALALEPGHPEAPTNLKLLRDKTGAVLWPRSWLDALVPVRFVDAYAIGGCVAVWIAVFALVAIFSTRRRETVGFWTCAVLALLVAGYAGAGVWRFESQRGRAIVTVKSAEVRLAPAESATTAGVLPAGSEVRILSERGDWTYCALPAQGRGWLPAGAVERVRPGRS